MKPSGSSTELQSFMSQKVAFFILTVVMATKLAFSTLLNHWYRRGAPDE
jgi:hypothetical protein